MDCHSYISIGDPVLNYNIYLSEPLVYVYCISDIVIESNVLILPYIIRFNLLIDSYNHSIIWLIFCLSLRRYFLSIVVTGSLPDQVRLFD